MDVSISPYSSFLLFLPELSQGGVSVSIPGFLIQPWGWHSKAKCVPAQCLSVPGDSREHPETLGMHWTFLVLHHLPSRQGRQRCFWFNLQTIIHFLWLLSAVLMNGAMWGWSHPSAGIAGMRAKPTCIYSNPTIRGIPFKCKIYWPTNSLSGSVACQPKCCLNYSENTECVEGGGAHSQLCASSSCNGIASPSSEISWNVCFDQYMQVLYNYRYKCTKLLFLGESLKF